MNIKNNLPDPGELVWKNLKCVYSFAFTHIDENSVLNHLRKLSCDSHLDVLQMDTRLLKLSADTIAPSITFILNCS